MRRALAVVLMLGGAFALAFGLDLLRMPQGDHWPPIGLAAAGGAALTLGIVLELRQNGRPAPRAWPRPASGRAAPLGTAILAFHADQPPRILSRDGDVRIVAEDDGTVRFQLGTARAADRLVCRSDSAWFNTLREDRQAAAIKLIGPLPPLVHLELWDRAALRKSA